jgi:hypothetical protein
MFYGKALLNGCGQIKSANGWIPGQELGSELQNVGGELSLVVSALFRQ